MGHVFIKTVSKVEDHPEASKPHLGVVTLDDGSILVSADPEPGVRRYRVGDLVVHIPHNSIVPIHLLKDGFWDDANDRPALSGPDRNRVKASKFAGVFSEGILFAVEDGKINNGTEILHVNSGDDVTDFLGITLKN